MRRSVSATSAGPRQDDLRALVHGHVDHLAVEVDGGRAAAHAVLERLDDPPRVLDLRGIGREDAVQHGHLVGMDAARALAAELARALGRLLEDGEVAESRDAADEARRLHARRPCRRSPGGRRGRGARCRRPTAPRPAPGSSPRRRCSWWRCGRSSGRSPRAARNPRGVSMARDRRRCPGARPRSRSRRSIRATMSRICAADSALGIDRPSSPGCTAASMSSASRAGSLFTRTSTSAPPRPARASESRTSVRALAFSWAGTESSRSRTMASAPRA